MTTCDEPDPKTVTLGAEAFAPCVCLVHGPSMAIPGNCSDHGWHCLLCVLEAAEVSLDLALLDAGCHPFAGQHIASITFL